MIFFTLMMIHLLRPRLRASTWKTSTPDRHTAKLTKSWLRTPKRRCCVPFCYTLTELWLANLTNCRWRPSKWVSASSKSKPEIAMQLGGLWDGCQTTPHPIREVNKSYKTVDMSHKHCSLRKQMRELVHQVTVKTPRCTVMAGKQNNTIANTTINHRITTPYSPLCLIPMRSLRKTIYCGTTSTRARFTKW